MEVHLLGRQRRPGGRAPGRVADPGREVPDDQHRDVAEVLELAQLAQHHGEARGGCRRRSGRCRASPAAAGRCGASAPSSGLGDAVDGARGQDPQLLLHGGHRRTLPSAPPRCVGEAPRPWSWTTMMRVRRSVLGWRAGRRRPRRGRVQLHVGPPAARAPGRVDAGALGRRHAAHHPPRRSRTASRSRSTRWRRTCPKAVVAIEDQRFFDHDGVDARGVVRALTRDVQEGNLNQGGSTITQQYVRAVMLGPEKDLERKLREAVMAVQLEHRYSKRTILERYLNTIYFGNGAYGVQAAAHRYFSRDVGDLDLAQSALLAGLIRVAGDLQPVRGARARARPAQRGARPHRPSWAGRRRPRSRRPARSRSGSRRSRRTTGTRRRTSSSRSRKLVHEQQGVRRHRGPAPAAAARRAACASTRRSTRRCRAWPSSPRPGWSRHPRPIPRPRWWRSTRRPATSRRTSAARTTGAPQPWAQVDLAEHRLLRGRGKGCRQAGSTFKPFVLAAALDAGVPLTRTLQARPRR